LPLAEPSRNAPAGTEPFVPSAGQREPRVTTIFLIGKLLSRHGETLCRIRNLSSGGLMAEAHVPIAKDDVVRIELKAGDRLPGRVRWARAGRMGVAFDMPVEVGALLARVTARTAGEKLARAPRFVADCPVELGVDGRRRSGRLVNVSQGGARLEAEFEAEKGQLMTLAIPGLPERQGSVRWMRDGALGLAFAEPLAFEELGIWLAERCRDA